MTYHKNCDNQFTNTFAETVYVDDDPDVRYSFAKMWADSLGFYFGDRHPQKTKQTSQKRKHEREFAC